ncbi:MAG: hypothetical protein U0793_31140 [Gemmataceae bacterium]
MTDYQIQPITRRCCVTGREMQPGERFFTALVADADHFRRADYSPEAWHGPPPGTFSFWTGKVPPATAPTKPRIDDDLLEECFHRLDGQLEPSRLNFRYVVALLLIRRKRLKFEQAITEDGVEKLVLRCPRSGDQYHVVNPHLKDDEMQTVQEEVFQVLGWN